MRRSEERHTIVVGTRVSPALAEKLKDLGRQTQRDTADVLRLLIRNAVVGAPDISSTVHPHPPVASAVTAEPSA